MDMIEECIYMPVRPKQSITQSRLVIPIAGTSNFIPNIACMNAPKLRLLVLNPRNPLEYFAGEKPGLRMSRKLTLSLI